MTQLISSMKLAFFPTVALLLFLAVFIAVLWKLLSREAGRVQELASIPLEDGRIVSTTRRPPTA